MTYKPIRPKFVRALPISSGLTVNQAMVTIFKLIYEFWGFCVNGSNDLKVPGGFATSQVTGSYISQAVGFQSGSTTLLCSGSDGSTTVGSSLFTTDSIPFFPTMVGKHIVIWKSGSTSTDDSVYVIRKWFSSGSIQIDPTTGATPIGVSGSVPNLTTRSNINYRVIDLDATRQLAGYVTDQYMVLQFNGASDVNPGQTLSQAKLSYRQEQPSGNSLGSLGITLSPSGSWDGLSTFLNESYPVIVPEITTSGPSTGGYSGESWFHGYNSNTYFVITLIGDNTALACFMGGSSLPQGASSFMIEIPQRLYPQNVDPNLICACNVGNLGVNSVGQPGWNYSGRFFPSPYDSLQRRWPVSVCGFTGPYWNNQMWGGNQYSLNMSQWSELFINSLNAKFLTSDAILGMGTVNGQTGSLGQYCMARARLRTCRYIPNGYPQHMRIGDVATDKWIHVGGGVLWPWDHAIVSGRDLFRGA